jgi:hypothetical protein
VEGASSRDETDALATAGMMKKINVVLNKTVQAKFEGRVLIVRKLT